MKFEIYKDASGEWRWRLVAKNNRIVADSGEGYKRKSAVKKIVLKIIESVSRQEIEIVEK